MRDTWNMRLKRKKKVKNKKIYKMCNRDLVQQTFRA